MRNVCFSPPAANTKQDGFFIFSGYVIFSLGITSRQLETCRHARNKNNRESRRFCFPSESEDWGSLVCLRIWHFPTSVGSNPGSWNAYQVSSQLIRELFYQGTSLHFSAKVADPEMIKRASNKRTTDMKQWEKRKGEKKETDLRVCPCVSVCLSVLDTI